MVPCFFLSQPVRSLSTSPPSFLASSFTWGKMKQHIFPTVAVALLSLDPLAAAAQRITAGQQGCPLDLFTKVASGVRCGTRSTVAFAVEWYGAEVAQLEKWFRLAGCGTDEAATEAVRVADRCQTRSSLTAHVDDGLQLRQPGGSQAGRLVGRKSLNLEARAFSRRASDDDSSENDSAEDDNTDANNSDDDNSEDNSSEDDSPEDDTTEDNNSDDDTTDDNNSDDNTDDSESTTSTTSTTSQSTSTSSTTLLTSTTSSQTTTSLASSTSYNPYVVARVSGTSTSMLTCMTVTTTTMTACSTHKTDHKYYSSCTTAPVAFPTCLTGLSCSFSQTSGAVSCYENDSVPVYGKIILAILGLAAVMAVSAIFTLCCRERNQVKRHRQAAEEKALLAATKTHHVGVTVEEVGFGAMHHQPAAHSDAAPLMRDDEAAHGATMAPQIVVSGGHTPTDEIASFPPGRYDPFADGGHHHEY